MHFCMGEMKEISISKDQAVQCPLCAKSSHKSEKKSCAGKCCENKTVELNKLEDNYISNLWKMNHDFTPDLFLICSFTLFHINPFDEGLLDTSHFQEDENLNAFGPPIFLRQQNFRI